ncbi:MAG: family N-acetyltransferase [Aeromicrobium sp.]|nr:family N-acetyltransferase [Aeromicrobium sp.]
MPPTIYTERLLLRPFADDDAPALFDIFRRPEVARWSGTRAPMTDVAQARQRIAGWPARAGAHPATGVFAMQRLDSGLVAGVALLVPLPASTGVDRDDHEIGWHLHPNHWGEGFATEAASALVERGFGVGLREIFAVTAPDNVRSQAVCARLGMVDLGLTSDWYDQELRAFRLDHP